jgi:hypothetical protein
MSKLTREQHARNKANKKKQKKPDTEGPVGGDPVAMKVVANAGDPGLTEPYFFDILSRYVICMIEPTTKVPTNSSYFKQFFLVKRPEHLWIHCEGTPELDPGKHYATTRRKDGQGNLNVGAPGTYSINTIPNLSEDYSIGQTLMCRKIPKEWAGESPGFNSVFSNVDFAQYYHNANVIKTGGGRVGNGTMLAAATLDLTMEYSPNYWTAHGTQASYAAPAGGGPVPRGNLEHKLKPLMQAGPYYIGPIKNPAKGAERASSVPPVNTFWFILHYYMIDWFLGVTNPQSTSTIEKLKAGQHKYQDPHGTGYVWDTGAGRWVQTKNLFPSGARVNVIKDDMGRVISRGVVKTDKKYIDRNIPFGLCEYEDTNTGNKQRISRDECMPLVIASPNNFPTPKERKIGSIVYNPAYATVVAAQTAGGSPVVDDDDGDPTDSGSLKTVPIEFNVIDNGDTKAARGTGWITTSDIQTNLNKINSLFASNNPATNIDFTWNGTINSVSVPSGTSYSQFDDTCKTLIPAVDPENNLNIWIIPCGGNAGDGCGSWATFPGQHGATTDGVVMSISNLVDGWSPAYGEGNILVHEIGHYLGLSHIWGDGDCNQDDGITDTPNQDGPTYGCPNPKPTACDGSTDVMTENYMNYTDDSCTNNFTQEQVDRMRATLLSVRSSLTS